MAAGRTHIRARWLLDGTGAPPIENAELVIEGDRISSIGHWNVAGSAPGTTTMEFPTGAVLPGLIDVHAHFTFGTGKRSYEEVMATDSDELMVERGQRNLASHRQAGVTTARDCGARNNTAFRLRALARSSATPFPRLLVSGPPLTRTRGHFWFCNGEADGVEGVELQVRKLLAGGADFIKIMASGGATIGTDSRHAAYSVAELAAAAYAAHEAGKLITAHCLSADSVTAALEAKIDQIEHINFLMPDGSRSMSQVVAERIVEQGVYVSPTIQTGYRRMTHLGSLPSPSAAERRELADLQYKLTTKQEFVNRLHELGARIVAGSDAIPSFGDYAIGLELLTEAGLSQTEAIGAATGIAAKAIGLANELGTLKVGLLADLVVVDGNPSADIRCLRYPRLVMRSGQGAAIARRFQPPT